jgi:hypothetical protein
LNSKEEQNKKFYFQEINKIIDFPSKGNHGKYVTYHIRIRGKEKANESGETAILGEFLDRIEVDRNYPHTVGYYKESIGEGACFCPEYLELRKIWSVEELWLFLNACDL